MTYGKVFDIQQGGDLKSLPLSKKCMSAIMFLERLSHHTARRSAENERKTCTLCRKSYRAYERKKE